MAKQGTVSVVRGLSRSFLRTSVLSAAILSAALLSSPSFAGETIPPPTPSSGSLPTASNPANNSTTGQMMAMQQAVMGQNANASGDPFQGNVPKSTSLSANFGWMDTFDNSVFNGGYGGGVTATHWITSKLALQASIEIESFGLGGLNNLGTIVGNSNQAGTPVIPITLGALYDFTGGKSWVNPQVFLDGGPAVTLNGETMPLYADIGVGVTTPLGKLSDALAGIDLLANIRMAYLSNMGGLADTATAADVTVHNGLTKPGSSLVGAMNQDMFYMPIEFGATFVF